jgi:hypothetical protein
MAMATWPNFSYGCKQQLHELSLREASYVVSQQQLFLQVAQVVPTWHSLPVPLLLRGAFCSVVGALHELLSDSSVLLPIDYVYGSRKYAEHGARVQPVSVGKPS